MVEQRTYRVNEILFERIDDVSARMHIVIDDSIVIYNILARTTDDETNPYTINYEYTPGKMLENLGILYAMGSIVCRFYIECMMDNVREAKWDRIQRDVTMRDERDFDVVVVEPAALKKDTVIMENPYDTKNV